MFEQREKISVFNKLRRGGRGVEEAAEKLGVPNVSTKLLSKPSGDVAAVFFRNWYIHSSVSKIISTACSISKGVSVHSYIYFCFDFHEQSSITATISAIIKESALRFFSQSHSPNRFYDAVGSSKLPTAVTGRVSARVQALSLTLETLYCHLLLHILTRKFRKKQAYVFHRSKE